MDSIAFGGLSYRNRYPVSASIDTGWTPLVDIGTLSLILMPGQYNPDALGAGVGRWVDFSGNSRHADTVNGANPTSSSGCPVFDGATQWLDIIGASLADNLSYPAASMSSVDNGTVIVVSKQDAPLTAEALNYSNPATISGTGATPGLYQTDAGARCTGYDATNYVDAYAAGGVAAAGVGHVHVGAWDATGLYSAIDATTLGAVTPYNVTRVSLSAGNIGADTFVGRGYSLYFAGTIYAVGVYPSVIADDTVEKWTSWARRRGFI